MARKIERMSEEELSSSPVLADLKEIKEEDLINSPKKRHTTDKIKKVAVTVAVILIALLYAAARLKL